MTRPTLTSDEKRIFDAIADVDDEWSTKPRCREKAGAKAAIGSIWHRLGWTLYWVWMKARDGRGPGNGAANE